MNHCAICDAKGEGDTCHACGQASWHPSAVVVAAVAAPDERKLSRAERRAARRTVGPSDDVPASSDDVTDEGDAS